MKIFINILPKINTSYFIEIHRMLASNNFNIKKQRLEATVSEKDREKLIVYLYENNLSDFTDILCVCKRCKTLENPETFKLKTILENPDRLFRCNKSGKDFEGNTILKYQK